MVVHWVVVHWVVVHWVVVHWWWGGGVDIGWCGGWSAGKAGGKAGGLSAGKTDQSEISQQDCTAKTAAGVIFNTRCDSHMFTDRHVSRYSNGCGGSTRAIEQVRIGWEGVRG